MAFIHSRLVWYAAAAFVVTVVLLATGCAHTSAVAQTQQLSRKELVSNYVYHKSMAKLRSAALVDSIMNDPETAVSAVKKTTMDPDAELDDLSSAYDTANKFTVERKGLIYVGTRVEGASADDDMFKIEIFEKLDGKLVRQPELEWEFLKHTDPLAAEQINKAAL